MSAPDAISLRGCFDAIGGADDRVRAVARFVAAAGHRNPEWTDTWDKLRLWAESKHWTTTLRALLCFLSALRVGADTQNDVYVAIFKSLSDTREKAVVAKLLRHSDITCSDGESDDAASCGGVDLDVSS